MVWGRACWCQCVGQEVGKGAQVGVGGPFPVLFPQRRVPLGRIQPPPAEAVVLIPLDWLQSSSGQTVIHACLLEEAECWGPSCLPRQNRWVSSCLSNGAHMPPCQVHQSQAESLAQLLEEPQGLMCGHLCSTLWPLTTGGVGI